LAAGRLPEGEFEADVMTDDVVISDLSGMLDSVVTYERCEVNLVLSRWLELDFRTMPPTYATSGLVYVLRLRDGSLAAIRFRDYMNTAGVKGYISFDYIYPLEL